MPGRGKLSLDCPLLFEESGDHLKDGQDSNP